MQPERPELEGRIAKWRQETIASLLKPLALRIAECSSIYRTVCKAGAFCPKGRTKIYMQFYPARFSWGFTQLTKIPTFY